MASVHLVRRSTATPSALWRVVTDFAAYDRWMPLTTVRCDEGLPRPGWGFAARSGLGPVGFTDSMLVTAWREPAPGRGGLLRVAKTGWVLGGWVEVTVEPHGDGSRLDWQEDVVVRPVPLRRWTDAAVRPAIEWLYARAVDAMVAEAESEAEGGRS